MKPTDFYIASRAFFGYVIPGAIIIAAGALLWGYNPISLLASTSATSLIFLLIVSFSIGSVIPDLTFPRTFRLGEWIVKHKYFEWQRLAWGTTSQSAHAIPEIFHTQVIQILQHKYPSDPYIKYLIDDYQDHILKHYPSSGAESSVKQKEVDQYHRSLVYEDKLGPILVRLTVGKSTHFDTRISEIRDEINLAGGIVIPLLLLVASWLFHGLWYGNQVGALVDWGVVIASCIVIIFTAFLFARRMYSLMLSERRLWLELFMLAQLLPNDQSIKEDVEAST